MLGKLAVIGAAGAVGTLSRYGLSNLVRYLTGRWWPAATAGSFPWPTFAVNILGCFAFGLIFAMSAEGGRLAPSVRIWALTGFMGAFTTYSTFEFETAQLLQNGGASGGSGAFVAAAYVLASLAVGLGAVFVGLRIGSGG